MSDMMSGDTKCRLANLPRLKELVSKNSASSADGDEALLSSMDSLIDTITKCQADNNSNVHALSLELITILVTSVADCDSLSPHFVNLSKSLSSNSFGDSKPVIRTGTSAFERQGLPAGTPLHYHLETGSLFFCISAYTLSDTPPRPCSVSSPPPHPPSACLPVVAAAR